MRSRKFIVSCVLSVGLWYSPMRGQQTPPPLLETKPAVPATASTETFKLGKIAFDGLQKRSAEAALALSGLQVGQTATFDEVEAAAQKLIDSGWFKSLGYKLKGDAEAVTLTFQVIESTAANVPVVFDNFVWFKDEDLAQLIRNNGVLGFDGTVPETGKAPELITQILQQHLDRNRIKGRVTSEVLTGATGDNARLLYVVKDIDLPVCDLTFPGATAVPEVLLRRTAVELLSQDYSRYTALVVARYKLTPLFRQRGYWRVQFQPAAAQFAKEDKACGNGVLVSIPVVEGPQFVWGPFTWAGNTAYTPQELDAAGGLKVGDIADETAYNKALTALNQLYQRKGYLELAIAPTPAFDDQAKRLSLRLTLTEGPQYKMGKLTLLGLPPAETLDLQRQWQLKPGAPFDTEYLKTFISDFYNPRLALLGPLPQTMKIVTKQTPDKQKLTVDVEINLVKANP